MELTNEFRVPVPVEQAWAILTDLERIAPCMPGAQLQEVEGEEYRGVVKVKVGPITAQYKGAATFAERDDAAHRAVLKAEGRDTRGQGNASAVITATLDAEGDGTRVQVHTDLTVTGKVAQFGRGVLADVSAKLLGQFVTCLETDVLAGDGPAATPDASSGNGASAPAPEPEPAAPPPAPAAPEPEPAPAPAPAAAAPEPAPARQTVRTISGPEAEPVDLIDSAGGAVAKRLAPVLGTLIVVFWLLRRRRRRRRRS